MNRLPALNPAQLVRALKTVGFKKVRQNGSHLVLVSQDQRRLVVVPMHKRDIKRGLLFGILKSAGLSQREFLELL
ncbi:MAG: type II toxin-antitoxin system HicA family toxin [Candidatus Peribacteraceae bacterium]|nr:type II toxin-antitoxin system HicA family toxin [Candidatus Peribacteraceae bacterium]